MSYHLWSSLIWLFATLDRVMVRAWLYCWKKREGVKGEVFYEGMLQ